MSSVKRDVETQIFSPPVEAQPFFLTSLFMEFIDGLFESTPDSRHYVHWLLPERQRLQHGLLLRDEILHVLAGVSDHLRELRLVEDLVFGGRLHFHELMSGGHNEVHIYVGARVLFVAEVEQYFSIHNSHAHS